MTDHSVLLPEYMLAIAPEGCSLMVNGHEVGTRAYVEKGDIISVIQLPSSNAMVLLTVEYRAVASDDDVIQILKKTVEPVLSEQSLNFFFDSKADKTHRLAERMAYCIDMLDLAGARGVRSEVWRWVLHAIQAYACTPGYDPNVPPLGSWAVFGLAWDGPVSRVKKLIRELKEQRESTSS